MRSATCAAIAFAKAEHARLGHPDDPEEFARGMGVKIIVGSDNYACDGPPSVISQTWDTYAPRQRFTIMHEMSHILMQRGGFEDDIMAEVDLDDAEEHLELVANHIAGALLIPDYLIQHYIKEYGFSPLAVLAVQATARVSFAATSRRMVTFDEDRPATIFLCGESYVLDVASSSPWNRIRRYDRMPDPRALLPEAELLSVSRLRARTMGVLQEN